MKYEVKIMDKEGKVCRIKLVLPFGGKSAVPTNSQWNVLDKDCLVYAFGGCAMYPMFPEKRLSTPWNLSLCVGVYSVIISLHNFIDNIGFTNSTGIGWIQRACCNDFTPSTTDGIAWALDD